MLAQDPVFGFPAPESVEGRPACPLTGARGGACGLTGSVQRGIN
jgi:hypothetical protein